MVSRACVAGGKQPAEAYDLAAMSPGQLELLPVAVSDSAGEAKFSEPPNPDDVSLSLANFQNDYVSNTRHIVMTTMAMQEALEG